MSVGTRGAAKRKAAGAESESRPVKKRNGITAGIAQTGENGAPAPRRRRANEMVSIHYHPKDRVL